MNIAVIRVNEIEHFPPAINLVRCMLSLGHNVTLIAHGLEKLPDDLRTDSKLELFDLGTRPAGISRLASMAQSRLALRNHLRSRIGFYDIVWATTDISAREAGRILYNFKYVIQLSELVEYVPLVAQRPLPIKSRLVEELAQNACAVVVPEYNRAHIQKAWWNLPELPTVLPNKPIIDNASLTERDEVVSDLFHSYSDRKVLLYQGVFTEDRNFEPFARAVEMLGEPFRLVMMGKFLSNKDSERIDSICKQYSHTVYAGFVPNPDHLAYTHYGYIGLLPYTPKKEGRLSVLNALYCAPNKIWEYSFFGLPMIGSDVPGLSSLFKGRHLGVTVDDANCEDIAEGVLAISRRYDEYSENSRNFFDSTDIGLIVKKIIDKCSY